MIYLYKFGCILAIIFTLMFLYTFLQVALTNDSCKKCRAIAVPGTCFIMMFQVAMLAEKLLS